MNTKAAQEKSHCSTQWLSNLVANQGFEPRTCGL
jgi:hypothetical protein